MSNPTQNPVPQLQQGVNPAVLNQPRQVVPVQNPPLANQQIPVQNINPIQNQQFQQVPNVNNAQGIGNQTEINPQPQRRILPESLPLAGDSMKYVFAAGIIGIIIYLVTVFVL